MRGDAEMVKVDICCPKCGKKIKTITKDSFNETVTVCGGCHARIRYSVSNGRAHVSVG